MFLEGRGKKAKLKQRCGGGTGDVLGRMGHSGSCPGACGKAVFGLFFGLFCLPQWNSAYSQIIQYISTMGACLVVNTLKDNEKSTLPSPTAFRAEIQAELSEKPLPAVSSKRLRERSVDASVSLKSKSIIKSESRTQNGSRVLQSNRSLQLEGMDSGPRPVKQVVISKEKPIASAHEVSERRIAEQEEDEEEEDAEEGEKDSDAEAMPEMETPANRLCDAEGNMLNLGLTDTDNRMIALTMAAKQPLKLNAVKLINGSIYSGEWLQGKRHGRGVLTWEDGSRYQGEWRHNFSWGHGKLTYNEHEYYEGSFLRNCREGHGRYVNYGVTYEGEWRNDRREGHGVESWGAGQHFEGEWVGGYKNGQGELVFEDGSYYRGEFCGNEIHGHGVYCWKLSRTYEGEWEHNRMSGLGVLLWDNGERYEGQFKNDKMHGLGVFTHADRSVSAGIFDSGKKHGVFTETDPDGNARQVEYYQGKKLRGEDNARPAKSHNRSYTASSATATNSF